MSIGSMVMLMPATLALALAVPPASAAEAQAPATKTWSYKACIDASDGITSMLNTCIQTESGRQDTRLNQAYAKLRASLDVSAQLKLRNEERAWIAMRDKRCAGKEDGGTADLLIANQCWLDRTKERAAELERRIAGGAGASAFTGKWGFRDDCDFGHAARIAFGPGNAPSGRWSDGTRNGGEAGNFVGRRVGNRLYVRFCDEEGSRGSVQCPAYGRQDDGYLVQEGGKLAWYRRTGEGASATFEKYLALDQDVGGKPAIPRRCPSGG